MQIENNEGSSRRRLVGVSAGVVLGVATSGKSNMNKMQELLFVYHLNSALSDQIYLPVEISGQPLLDPEPLLPNLLREV